MSVPDELPEARRTMPKATLTAARKALPREQELDHLQEELERGARALIRAMERGDAASVLAQVAALAGLQKRVRNLHVPRTVSAYVNSPIRSGSRVGFHASLLAMAEEEGLPVTGAHLRYQCGPVHIEVDPSGEGVRIDGKLHRTYRVPYVIKMIRRRLDALGRAATRSWAPAEFALKVVEAYDNLRRGRAKDVALVEVYRWFLNDSGTNGMVYPKRVFAADLGGLLAQAETLLSGWRLSLDPVRDVRLAFMVPDSTGKEISVGSIRLSKEAGSRVQRSDRQS